MSQKSYRAQIEDLLQMLDPSPQHQQESTVNTINSQLFKCKSNFIGTVEKNILLFKCKIIEMLKELNCLHSDPLNSAKSAVFIEKLSNKLQTLNGDLDHLLQEGILTLYIDLTDLRQLGRKINLQLQQFTIKIVEEFSCLIRQYFAFQEYQTQKKKSDKQRKNSCFSLRKIPSFNSQTTTEGSGKKFDDNLLLQIEADIAKRPLSDLFDKEMKKQEKKMAQSFQICRICEQKIKLNNLQRHVNICHEKSELRQKIQCQNHHLSLLETQLLMKYQQSCSEMVNQNIDEEFRKICKLILNPSRKNEKCLPRRNSLIGFKSQKNIDMMIEVSIEDYIEEFGNETLLQQILEVIRRRTLIVKRLNNLEMNSLFAKENQNAFLLQAGGASPKKARKKQGQYRGHKNSVFKPIVRENEQRKDCSAELVESNVSSKSSQIDINSKQSQMERFETKTSGRIHSRSHSRKSYSRKCPKQKQQQQFEAQYIKKYKSCEVIPNSQWEEAEGKCNVELKDFTILQFLGQGAFGKVYLVRRKETNDVYALKIVKPSDNCDEKQLASIRNEHEIFMKIAGQHLVTAPFSFSERSCHIFVLEYMPGGDLRKLLTEEVYLEENIAQFYLAEIILAIEHLHKYGIIHRDLKPENLVIDKNGHLKLTDFGLSEFQATNKWKLSQKTQDECLSKARSSRKRRTAVCGVNKKKLIGTPDYIAPEIIHQTSLNNYTIDWWSLGVMAYQMLIGCRPFSGYSIDEVIDNITKFHIEWPEVGTQEGMISPQAKDFIEKLLNKDFSNRLGAKSVNEIKDHPFMRGIDWENIKVQKPAWLPSKIMKVSDLINMKEDLDLKKQILDCVGKKGKEIHLKTCIRYDLLKSQTIQNMQDRQRQTTGKLKKLKTLVEFTYCSQLKNDLIIDEC